MQATQTPRMNREDLLRLAVIAVENNNVLLGTVVVVDNLVLDGKQRVCDSGQVLRRSNVSPPTLIVQDDTGNERRSVLGR